MPKLLTRLLARLVQDHITIEKKSAFKEGVTAGQNASAKLLQEKDKAIARLESSLAISRGKEGTWTITDKRSVPQVIADTALYGPDRFPVTAEMIAAMRAEVAQAVESGKISPPTEAQWAMILSDHPATCVVAGAGSGKSTTLVLRVIFMICHLKIRPRSMTVVSFTKASCTELREKVHKVLTIDHWKAQLHPDDVTSLPIIAQYLVSTFHSVLNRMARGEFPGMRWFDFLKDNEKNGDESLPDVEFDNPFASNSRLSERQIDLLKEAYRAAFNENETFRHNIVELVRIECAQDELSEQEETRRTGEILRIASDRDLEIVKLINEKWKDTGWIMEGVDPTPFVAFTAEGHEFYANGRIVDGGTPVFLSLNGYLNETPLFGDDEKVRKFPLRGALRVRRDITAKYYAGKKLDLRSTHALERLALRVKFLGKKEFQRVDAPPVSIKLSGEISESAIYEAFFTQGSFIENLGLEVPETVGNLRSFRNGSVEHYFSAALAYFWPIFENVLERNAVRLMTFNRAFLLLGEGYLDRPLMGSQLAITPFTHLLVDEFQDISPQIVSWLRATQRRVQKLSLAPSLMAIGDDWQSIYGWRGSAPELFIDFEKHFKCSQTLGYHECKMMENYRSVAPILTDAERILEPVSIKIKKEAIPKRPTDETDHGVRLVTGINLDEKLDVVLKEIEEQLAFVNSLPKPDKKKVLVLSRSSRLRDKISAIVKSNGLEGVYCYTFHGAKGLQGEVAILCENSAYDLQHLFRNAVYAASGLFNQSYDQAAKDEALRLAYVGITRGIRRVIWFVDEPKGATAALG